MAMFTLRDAIELAKGADSHQTGLGSIEKQLQYESAVLGDYVLTDKMAKNELARRAGGEHGLDNPRGTDYLGNQGGKLPSHPTFSDQSPYYIKGLSSAEGGTWTNDNGKDVYIPHPAQFSRDPGYMDKLLWAFDREKGNGIDAINLPDGTVHTESKRKPTLQ